MAYFLILLNKVKKNLFKYIYNLLFFDPWQKILFIMRFILVFNIHFRFLIFSLIVAK
jgi:hypothetical protein